MTFDLRKISVQYGSNLDLPILEVLYQFFSFPVVLFAISRIFIVT